MAGKPILIASIATAVFAAGVFSVCSMRRLLGIVFMDPHPPADQTPCVQLESDTSLPPAREASQVGNIGTRVLG